jgi:hypothetical protein
MNNQMQTEPNLKVPSGRVKYEARLFLMAGM